MLKISSVLIITGSITLAWFAVPAKSQVFRPQTAEEIEFVEAHGFEMLPEAPFLFAENIRLAALPVFLAPPLESPEFFEQSVVTHAVTANFIGQHEFDTYGLRQVSSDDGMWVSPSHPVPARLVSWQAPVPQPAACTGVCVTYSSQGATALRALTGKRIKGFQLVQATTCADHDAKFGAGRIIQQANAMGIQTLSAKTGAAVVQQTVDLNWRKLLILGVQVGTSVALGVTTSGVVTSSKAITTGIALGHLALDELPTVLKPGTPNPDPFFSAALDESGQVTISAGACVSAIFAGTWDKNSPKVTGRIQLLP